MGNNRILIPKGKFFLRAISKRSEVKSIYIRYVFNRTSIVRPVANYQCKDADWNQNGNMGRGEVRASYGTDFKRVNSMLAKKVADIDNALVEYNNAHPNKLTVQIVRDIMDGKTLSRQDEGKDFIAFADEITESKYKESRISHSTYKNRLCCMRKFKKFLKSEIKKDSIFIGDMSKEVVSKYIQWRKSTEDNSHETINHALTPLIDACERAADLGLLPKSEYADIKRMRLPKIVSFNAESEENSVRYLEKEELKRLADYAVSEKEPRRKEYLDMFMFAFHSCGLRVVDIMTLQWKHIDFGKKQLRKILVKTANYRYTTHTVPLTAEAIEILERWKQKCGDRRFVFGLLDDDIDLDDRETLYKNRNNITKCINQSLTVVGEKMNFSHPLTMHVARHTFAVLALNDGMAMSVVSRLLGHASTAVTEKVYAKYLPETLEEEVNRLDFGFLAG